MASVSQYQKRPGLSQQVIPVAGTVLGGMVGGPAGAAVGGMVGGKVAGGDNPAVGPVQPSAMERRLAPPPPAANPSQDINNANQALAQLPPDQQQKYGPILRRAKMLDDQSQQGVV